jgi:hypothetical protein
MQQILKELKHALRALVRSPGFTLATVAALALGSGATTASRWLRPSWQP